MICPKCDKEYYEDNANFCTDCGTHLIRNRSAKEFSRKEPKAKIDILIEQNRQIIKLLEGLSKPS